MSFWNFLKRKKASVPLISRLITGVSGLFSSSKSYQEYYTGWIFACVRAIAEDVAKMQFVLYRTDAQGNREVVHEHPILDLLSKVNEYMTQFTLIERLQSNLELTGNEYWYLEKGKGNVPVEIYPLRPELVTPIAGRNDYVIGYKYTLDGDTTVLKPTDVIQFKTYNPKSDIVGVGTLTACRLAADTDNYAKVYNKKYFENDARPDVILEYPETLTPEQEKRLLDAWQENHGGQDRQFKTAVASGGLKISSFQITQRDMEFLAQRQFSRDEILAIFRVPPTVLGIATETTFASAKAVNYSFALRVIAPKMQRIIDTLNEFLLPLFGESGLTLDFVSPVQEDRLLILQEYKDGLANGWLTINEIRRREEMPDVENGDFVFMPFNLTPYGQPVKEKKVERPVTKFASDIASAIVKSIGTELVTKEAKPEVDPAREAFEKMGLKKSNERNERGLEYEKNFNRRLNELWTEQKKEVKKNLLKYLNQKNWKASVPNLLDEPAQAKATIDLFTPLFTYIVAQEGESAADDLKLGDFTITPNLKKFIEKNTKKFAGEVTKETSKQIRATIVAGIEQNETIPELEKRIDTLAAFGPQRAEMIARTETIRAQSKSELEVWQDSGVVVEKKWYTAQDERDCDDCDAMHGKTISVEETYFDRGDKTASGAVLDYEDVGGPPLHPNCRCALVPVVSSKSAKKKVKD